MLFAAGSFATAFSAGAFEISKPKAVVELFTSQGCHACPPADKSFAKLVKEKGILGLSFHVDYWDRLGWKDTFGSEEFTLRQYNYAWAQNLSSAYTPQAIVNGRKQLVGTKDDQIREWADVYEKAFKGMTVPVEVTKNDLLLDIKIGAQDGLGKSNLMAIYFDDLSTVKIPKGANRGKVIDYANIVKKVEYLGTTDQNGLKLSLSLQQLYDSGFSNIALILQSQTEEGMVGPIMGATLLTNPKST